MKLAFVILIVSVNVYAAFACTIEKEMALLSALKGMKECKKCALMNLWKPLHDCKLHEPLLPKWKYAKGCDWERPLAPLAPLAPPAPLVYLLPGPLAPPPLPLQQYHPQPPPPACCAPPPPPPTCAAPAPVYAAPAQTCPAPVPTCPAPQPQQYFYMQQPTYHKQSPLLFLSKKGW